MAYHSEREMDIYGFKTKCANKAERYHDTTFVYHGIELSSCIKPTHGRRRREMNTHIPCGISKNRRDTCSRSASIEWMTTRTNRQHNGKNASARRSDKLTWTPTTAHPRSAPTASRVCFGKGGPAVPPLTPLAYALGSTRRANGTNACGASRRTQSYGKMHKMQRQFHVFCSCCLYTGRMANGDSCR